MHRARWRSISKALCHCVYCVTVYDTLNMSCVSLYRAASCPCFLGTEMVQAGWTLGLPSSQPGLDCPLWAAVAKWDRWPCGGCCWLPCLVGHSKGKWGTSMWPFGMPHVDVLWALPPSELLGLVLSMKLSRVLSRGPSQGPTSRFLERHPLPLTPRVSPLSFVRSPCFYARSVMTSSGGPHAIFPSLPAQVRLGLLAR